MASLIPSGSATGSGSVTLTVPTTNSNQTATLPDATGTVMVSGNQPAFNAFPSTSTSLTSAVNTKITFDTKVYDTANCFNTTLNRFTPNVAGYYLITSTVSFSNVSTYFTNFIYKNGSLYRQGVELFGGALNFFTTSVTTVMYLNGTTDYVEVYGVAGSTATTVGAGNATQNYFEGCLLRAS